MAEQVAAAEVYTGRGGASRGDNSGGAAIFDVPNIKADPNPYGPLAGQYLANEGRKAVKELELKQKRDKELADLSKLKIDNLWINYEDDIIKDAEQKSQKLAEIQVAGGDDVRQNVQREAMKFQAELDTLAKTTLDAKEKYEAFVKGKELLSKPESVGVYDEELYAQKMKELDLVVNGGTDEKGNTVTKKSPKEALEWLNDPNNYPIQAYANLDKIVDSVTPSYTQEGRRQFVDEKALRNNVDMWAAGNQPAIETLQRKYKLAKPEDAVELIVKTSLNKNQPKTAPPPSGGGGINIGFGSGGNEKVSWTVETDPTEGLIQDGRPNRFSVKRTGTQDDLPFISVRGKVTDPQGAEVEVPTGGLANFQPSNWVVGKDGKIGVEGVMSIPVKDSMGKISGTENKTVWIDYESNKSILDPQLGTNPYKILGRDKKGASEAKPKDDSGNYTIKGKTYTLSQLEGMGYTKEQVEQYKAK